MRTPEPNPSWTARKMTSSSSQAWRMGAMGRLKGLDAKPEEACQALIFPLKVLGTLG